MTVGDARKFLIRAVSDMELRNQLNEAPTWDAMAKILEAHNVCFTQVELEEAFNSILVHSQTRDEADLIREIKGWWNFLMAAISR